MRWKRFAVPVHRTFGARRFHRVHLKVIHLVRLSDACDPKLSDALKAKLQRAAKNLEVCKKALFYGGFAPSDK